MRGAGRFLLGGVIGLGLGYSLALLFPASMPRRRTRRPPRAVSRTVRALGSGRREREQARAA